MALPRGHAKTSHEMLPVRWVRRLPQLIEGVLGLFAIVRGGSNLARCLPGLGDAGQTLTNQRPHSRNRSRPTWGFFDAEQVDDFASDCAGSDQAPGAV